MNNISALANSALERYGDKLSRDCRYLLELIARNGTVSETVLLRSRFHIKAYQADIIIRNETNLRIVEKTETDAGRGRRYHTLALKHHINNNIGRMPCGVKMKICAMGGDCYHGARCRAALEQNYQLSDHARIRLSDIIFCHGSAESKTLTGYKEGRPTPGPSREGI